MTKPIICITGGGTGIGYATAKQCLQAGYQVIIAGRRESVLTTAVATLSDYGPDIYSYQTDISNPDSVKQLFEYIKKKFNRLDCLVNNASIISVDQLTDMAVDAIQTMVSTNILGTVYCSRQAIPLLSQAKTPSIITVTSLGGISGTTKFPGFSVYSLTKGAIIIFTEALAVELKPHNIRVVGIAPGAVDTAMLKQAGEHLKTQTQPDDIAQTILFLAQANPQSGLTGTTLEIHSND